MSVRLTELLGVDMELLHMSHSHSLSCSIARGYHPASPSGVQLICETEVVVNSAFQLVRVLEVVQILQTHNSNCHGRIKQMMRVGTLFACLEERGIKASSSRLHTTMGDGREDFGRRRGEEYLRELGGFCACQG